MGFGDPSALAVSASTALLSLKVLIQKFIRIPSFNLYRGSSFCHILEFPPNSRTSQRGSRVVYFSIWFFHRGFSSKNLHLNPYKLSASSIFAKFNRKMRIRAAAFASVALVFSQSFCNLQFVDAASSRVSIAPSTSATESKTTEKQDKTSSLDASAAKEAVVSAHDTSSTSSQTAQLRSLQNGPPASFIRTNGPKDITEGNSC